MIWWRASPNKILPLIDSIPSCFRSESLSRPSSSLTLSVCSPRWPIGVSEFRWTLKNKALWHGWILSAVVFRERSLFVVSSSVTSCLGHLQCLAQLYPAFCRRGLWHWLHRAFCFRTSDVSSERLTSTVFLCLEDVLPKIWLKLYNLLLLF